MPALVAHVLNIFQTTECLTWYQREPVSHSYPSEVATDWFSFIKFQSVGQLCDHISRISAAGQTDMLLYLFNSSSFIAYILEAFMPRWALRNDEWNSLMAFVIFMNTWKVHINGYVCIQISDMQCAVFV